MMNYKIIFSDKRRTMSIKLRFSEVTVNAPLAYNNARGRALIAEFVRAKEAWLLNRIRGYEENITRYLPDILDLKKFYWHGSEIMVSMTKSKKVTFDGHVLALPYGDINSLQSSIKKIFRKQASQELLARLQFLADHNNIKFERCAISDAMNYWGLCTSKNGIRLNWRLALLRPDLADYVMLHELCHIGQMNHSKLFWDSLEKCLPQHETMRKELRNYDFIMTYLRKTTVTV